MQLDCQSCGACCCNPDANRAEGTVDYVEVPPDHPLQDRPDAKKWLVTNGRGEVHLRLQPSGRCAALKGPLGDRVQCQIYAFRAPGCRTVQPGDEECLRARRERGIG